MKVYWHRMTARCGNFRMPSPTEETAQEQRAQAAARDMDNSFVGPNEYARNTRPAPFPAADPTPTPNRSNGIA